MKKSRLFYNSHDGRGKPRRLHSIDPRRAHQPRFALLAGEDLMIVGGVVENCGVARTCRHFGISRTTFHKWRHRFAKVRAAALGNAYL